MGGPFVPAPQPLVHRAVLHGHEGELLRHLATFAREGAAVGEATMVLTTPRRMRALRRELGPDATVTLVTNHLAGMRPGVAFDDVRRHLAARAGTGRLRVAADWDLGGLSPSRRRAFMRWEAAATALLSGREATLLCCHDGCDAEIAAEVRAGHPEVWRDGAWSRDDAYVEPARRLRECAAPPPLGTDPLTLADPWALAPLRERIARAGAAAGIDAGEVADFEIAANEVAANALWHAHGPREARVAVSGGALVCEIRDGGPGLDPLRAHAPPEGAGDGRGLWIAHQLADTVQVIPDGAGTRVRMELEAPVAVSRGTPPAGRRLRGSPPSSA